MLWQYFKILFAITPIIFNYYLEIWNFYIKCYFNRHYSYLYFTIN